MTTIVPAAPGFRYAVYVDVCDFEDLPIVAWLLIEKDSPRPITIRGVERVDDLDFGIVRPDGFVNAWDTVTGWHLYDSFAEWYRCMAGFPKD